MKKYKHQIIKTYEIKTTQFVSGEKITESVLNEIIETFSIYKHAVKQLYKRHNGLHPYEIEQELKNNILAYYNTDGSINIAINEWEYYVVNYSNIGWTIHTFKEKSYNNINIYSKWNMAKCGYARKIAQPFFLLSKILICKIYTLTLIKDFNL